MQEHFKGDLASFREAVGNEVKSCLTLPTPPLFGLDTMGAYHMGMADQKGNLRDDGKGKYLRPLFCLAICAGLGGDPDKAIPAAASLEMAHRTSLIFDDIQDSGKERNSQPTVWSIWGTNQAINAGLALSCHARLAAQKGSACGLSPETTLRILSVLENAVIHLLQGQYLDLSFGETVNLTIGDYLRMVEGKTGALFGAACEVGALCAGVEPDRVKLAREFGIAMGVAFQIWDDYLGIWGDEAKVGKPANDLTEKKRSLPVVLALQSYPTLMGHYFKQLDAEPDVVDTIRSWMENRGIDAKTRTMAIDFATTARVKLRELHLDSLWYHEINQLLGFVVERAK